MINGAELLRLIDSISRDRNVEKELLYRDIEQALVSAARKHFDAPESEEFFCELDRMNGQLKMWRNDEEIDLVSLGRIPAQTAKQVMIQRFREDERESIYSEYADRMGELVTGMAQRMEGGALVISIGRAEGFMPRSEQIPGERHQPGERVRCIILDVRDVGNQVKIVLSRASPDFIKRLFEVEVPEVAERIIEIKAMAREPGHRTKIAVSSIDSKVDAVGACVGVRGSRIKNIVDELGGEKIDIVRWNESSQILIQNALKPAEVVEISLCFELGRATVVVNEDQLSLAIGKRGQNVRLAARLTNWDVDILTPAEFTKGLDIMEETLRQIEGIDDDQIDRLAALGVISVFDVEEVGAEYIAETIDCTVELAEKAIVLAAERAKVVAVEQQKEKEEAAKRKAEEAQGLIGLPGEQRAASILSDLATPIADGGKPAGAGTGSQDARTSDRSHDDADNIVDMIASRHQEEAQASAGRDVAWDSDAEPADLSMSRQVDPADMEDAEPFEVDDDEGSSEGEGGGGEPQDRDDAGDHPAEQVAAVAQAPAQDQPAEAMIAATQGKDESPEDPADERAEGDDQSGDSNDNEVRPTPEAG